jgi:hypothetical protein
LRELLDELFAKDWVDYCKPPFGGSRQVLEYLARYTHRVAIANDRLVRMDGEQVVFRYRDRARAPCGEGAAMSAPLTAPPSPPASLLGPDRTGPDRGFAALVRCLKYHGTNCTPETWRRLGFRKGRMRRGARTCNRRPLCSRLGGRSLMHRYR